MEVRNETLLNKVAYFDKKEMAFGLIAKRFSKCETKLTAEFYKIDPTLKPGTVGADRPNGSRTAKTYVLQNVAGGVYATYELKFGSLRLHHFKGNVKELLSAMDGLYVLVEHVLVVTDAAKMLQL